MSNSQHPLHALVRRLHQHVALDEADHAALFAVPFKLRNIESAAYLVREGDTPRICSVLVTGHAFRQKLTGDGLRQIIGLHVPGDALDFQNLFLDVSDHNAQMLTRGQVADVPIPAFQALAMARPAIARAIQVSTLIEASIFREWVLNIGRRDARGRVAHLLCEFALRLESDRPGATPHSFELPMTQEQLADSTGLTPVHINRVLKMLESEGLIERTRRTVRFPDWNEICHAADFSPRYLHIAERAAHEQRAA